MPPPVDRPPTWLGSCWRRRGILPANHDTSHATAMSPQWRTHLCISSLLPTQNGLPIGSPVGGVCLCYNAPWRPFFSPPLIVGDSLSISPWVDRSSSTNNFAWVAFTNPIYLLCFKIIIVVDFFELCLTIYLIKNIKILYILLWFILSLKKIESWLIILSFFSWGQSPNPT
jgi:hypothetical protein